MPDTGPAHQGAGTPAAADIEGTPAGPGGGPQAGVAPARMNRVLQNSSLYLIGNIASRAVGFLAIPFYSRLLTPTQFGIIDLIELSTQTVAIAFGLQSIGQALTRLFHDQATAEQERDVVSTGLIATALISGVIALLAIAFAGPLATAIFGSGDQTALLRAAFAAMFFANLVEVVLVYERIRERAMFYLAYSLVTLAANLALNFFFIGALGAGVWGFVLSKLIVTIAGTTYLLARTWREIGWRWRGHYIPEFARFGSPLILSSLSYLSIHSADRFFLAAAVSFADIGRYGLAYKFAFLVSILVGESFGKSWNVSLYRYVDRDGWREQFARVASYLLYVLCLAGLGLSVFGPELLRFMVPPAFYPPALLLPVLVFAYVIREFGDFFRNLLLIRKRSVAVGVIAFGGALLNAGLNVALIRQYGIFGAAIATLATWVAYLAVCWVVSAREHAIPVSVTRSLGLVAGTVLAFAVTDATRVSGYIAQLSLDAIWCALFAAIGAALYFTREERAGIHDAAAPLIARAMALLAPRRMKAP